MNIYEIAFHSGEKYWASAFDEDEAIKAAKDIHVIEDGDEYTVTELPRDTWKSRYVINYRYDDEKYDEAAEVPESEWKDGVPPEETFEEYMERSFGTPQVFCSTEWDGL